MRAIFVELPAFARYREEYLPSDVGFGPRRLTAGDAAHPPGRIPTVQRLAAVWGCAGDGAGGGRNRLPHMARRRSEAGGLETLIPKTGRIVPIMGNVRKKAPGSGLAGALFTPVQQRVLGLLSGTERQLRKRGDHQVGEDGGGTEGKRAAPWDRTPESFTTLVAPPRRRSSFVFGRGTGSSQRRRSGVFTLSVRQG